MLYITQNSSMFHLLLMVTLCLHKCVGNIEENKYAFMKMISMNEEQNVYYKFLIPYKRNYILTCGAKCGIDESCMGIDVCDGRICRLWNATFYPSLLSNDSNGLCKRYIKVSMLGQFKQSTLEVMEISSYQAHTSSAQDQSSVSDTKTQSMPSEAVTSSSNTSANEIPTTNITTSSHTEITTGDTPTILSPTETTFTDITTTSSLTETTTTDVNLTKTSNTNASPSNIQSTQPSTNEIHLATTSETFPTERSTSTVSNDEINTTTGVITTERPIQNCTMAYEFSEGDREVPCFNDTYSWIVIQRRFDGSVDFYRNWTEYENGFGSLQSEIWLGNQYINELTNAGYTVLRIELTGFNGEMRHIEYNFNIENKTNDYRMHISERNVSGIDSLYHSDTAFFCTFDKDNDNWNAAHCADMSEKASGWWHSKAAWCTDGNLNGIYKNEYMNYQQGIHWFAWDGQWTLKETKMMLRKP